MSEEKTAFIYTRISVDKAGNRDATHNQQAECEDLAERLGFRVVGVFPDDGISAYSGKPRPKYEEMVSRLGEVDAVLAWAPDRLYRSMNELEAYLDASEAHGTPTYTARGGNVDFSTPNGRFTARMAAAIAVHESDQKSERIRMKRRKQVERGQVPGGVPPFGWSLDRERGGTLTIDEREASAFRQAVADVIEGRRSLNAICRDWNDPDREGGALTTGWGTPWTPQALRKLLRRPHNWGRYELWSTEDRRADKSQRRPRTLEAVGEVPPLISRATFDKLQRVLDGNRVPGRANRAAHLLSGIAECACGHPAWKGVVTSRSVDPETGEKRRRYVYRCTRRGAGPDGTHVGPHSSRGVEDADAVVKLAVYELLTMDLSQRPGLSPEQEQERAEIEAELAELGHQLEGLEVALEEGSMTPRLAGNAERRIMERQGVLRSRLAELPSGEAGDPLSLVRAAREREQVELDYRDWLGWHVDDQREFIRHRLRVRLLPRDPHSPRKFDPATVDATARQGLDPQDPGAWYWEDGDPEGDEDAGYRAPLIRDGERVGVMVWGGPVIGQPVGGYWAGIEDFHERAQEFERRRARLEELEES